MAASWISLRRGTDLFCCLLFVIQCAGCTHKNPSPGASPQVLVARVVQKDVSVYSEWVATLDGYVNAQIQPQVSGYLIKQDYPEGSFVHKDDVLFEIDPRPFQAVLDQAKAQLAQAKAQADNAGLRLSRTDRAVKAGVAARQELEDALDHLDTLSVAGDHTGARRALLKLAAPATTNDPNASGDRSSTTSH